MIQIRFLFWWISFVLLTSIYTIRSDLKIFKLYAGRQTITEKEQGRTVVHLIFSPRKIWRVPCKIFPVKSSLIFTGCSPNFFLMTSNFFQGAPLKKNLGRFYRVDFTGYIPFKSILRVQIKRELILNSTL